MKGKKHISDHEACVHQLQTAIITLLYMFSSYQYINSTDICT